MGARRGFFCLGAAYPRLLVTWLVLLSGHVDLAARFLHVYLGLVFTDGCPSVVRVRKVKCVLGCAHVVSLCADFET